MKRLGHVVGVVVLRLKFNYLWNLTLSMNRDKVSENVSKLWTCFLFLEGRLSYDLTLFPPF